MKNRLQLNAEFVFKQKRNRRGDSQKVKKPRWWGARERVENGERGEAVSLECDVWPETRNFKPNKN